MHPKISRWIANSITSLTNDEVELWGDRFCVGVCDEFGVDVSEEGEDVSGDDSGVTVGNVCLRDIFYKNSIQ